MTATTELQKQIADRDATINRLKEALTLQDDYIKLLTEEIGSMLPVADAHGWRSTRHEAGKELRAKIENARKLIEP